MRCILQFAKLIFSYFKYLHCIKSRHTERKLKICWWLPYDYLRLGPAFFNPRTSPQWHHQNNHKTNIWIVTYTYNKMCPIILRYFVVYMQNHNLTRKISMLFTGCCRSQNEKNVNNFISCMLYLPCNDALYAWTLIRWI